MPNPDFLKQKYNLQNAPEVKRAAERAERRAGEKIPSDPEARIQNYLDRLKNIISPPKLKGREDFDRRERNLSWLKNMLHEREVIKPEEIPESYFESIRQRHREEGHGEIEIPEEYRRDLIGDLIRDQEKSLDRWIDYLASPDAKYPDWLKYCAFRSILKMGRYDKQKKKFTERYGGTIAPFPDINREALGIVMNDLEVKYPGQIEDKKTGARKKENQFLKRFDIKEEIKEKYKRALENKNFAELYALAIEEFKPIPEELLKIIEGEWVKYPRNSDYTALVDSISDYGTGWCLRGKSMSERYLKDNDLYAYYSQDKKGNPAVPRVVMVVNRNNQITEVRGVAEGENLDPYIGEVVESKLNEPEFEKEGRRYKKKSADMKRLTAIDKKVKANQDLTKDDLIFLYEIDFPIEGFGYNNERDPRIEEIQRTRNPKEDAPIVLDCLPDQIAWKEEEINENTKVYIGPSFKRIFQKNLEHIYISFPERKISRVEATIGGQSEEQIRREIEKREESEGDDKIYVSHWAKDMLKNKDFYTLKNKEQITLIKLKVKDLGFPNGATTEEIYQRAEEYGLELCPPEVGPRLCLNYEQIFKREQPRGDYFWIAMKQITVSAGDSGVFCVGRQSDGKAWLRGSWGRPEDRWFPVHEFVFRLRKFES